MPIPFACECGKKMSAKEEFAGRHMRCPECQRVIVIPKVNLASSVKLKASKPKPSRTLTRSLTPPATLTREELAAMAVSRPIQETPPAAKTLPIDSDENLAALFAPSVKAAPATAPMVAHVVAPVVAPQVATVVSAAVNEPAAPTGHPWVDKSLEQTATPWRPGDQARYQVNFAGARESEGPIGWLVPLVAIAGTIAATVYLP